MERQVKNMAKSKLEQGRGFYFLSCGLEAFPAMKNFLPILLFALVAGTSFGQVAGVSNDKLVVVNPTAISTRAFEFEPAFGYLWSAKRFDENSKLVSLSAEGDSTTVLQALAFRFTYGFAKNFEIGSFITSDLNTFSLGLKYSFLNTGNFLMGAFTGTTFSTASDIVFRNTGFFGNTASVVAGVALMAKFSEKLSLDVDVQYQNVFDNKRSYADDVFSAAELGYRFPKHVQLIGGFSFRYNHFKTGRPEAYLLTFNPGITVQPGESFVMILNVPFDIIGKNTDKYNGFTFTLTISLD